MPDLDDRSGGSCFWKEFAMNRYAQMIERQSKEIYGLMERLPVVFVFAEEQFAEGMRKLGLEPDQTDLVCRIAETGAMLRKSDANELIELVVRRCGEQLLAFDSDPTREGVIAEMSEYELRRCEYNTNLDILKVFKSAGITHQDTRMEILPRIHIGKAKCVFCTLLFGIK